MADIFDAEVVTIQVSEGAAYGAALQAMWCWHVQRGEKVGINDITGEFVQLNRAETARPNKASVKLYREWQSIQDGLSVALRPVFIRHRRFTADSCSS
jgi:xylulokinase